MDVVANEALNRLQEALQKHLEKAAGWKNERPQRFHPHVTIAHRDLDRQVFEKARSHFSKIEYRRTFRAESLTLLEHRRGRWEILEDYPF